MINSCQRFIRLTVAAGCLLTLLLAGAATADPYDFEFDQGHALMVIPVNWFQQFHSTLTNTGDNPDSYTLNVVRDQPTNWTFNVCYGGVCYDPTITQLTVPAEGTLAPGEEMLFDFDVTSLEDLGSATYSIEFVSNNDGAVVATASFTAYTPFEDTDMELVYDGTSVIQTTVNNFVAEHVYLYNAGTLDDTYTLTVERDLPENWTSTFCFGGICYSPDETTRQIPDGPGAIASAEMVQIDLDFTTLEDEGTGYFTLIIASNTDPSLVSRLVFTVTTATDLVGVGDVPVSALASSLRAAPNPFNPRTEVMFTVGGDATRPVVVEVHDLLGRRVRTLHAGPLSPGEHRVSWDGLGEYGQQVATGTYLARVRVGQDEANIKMSLMK